MRAGRLEIRGSCGLPFAAGCLLACLPPSLCFASSLARSLTRGDENKRRKKMPCCSRDLRLPVWSKSSHLPPAARNRQIANWVLEFEKKLSFMFCKSLKDSTFILQSLGLGFSNTGIVVVTRERKRERERERERERVCLSVCEGIAESGGPVLERFGA